MEVLRGTRNLSGRETKTLAIDRLRSFTTNTLRALNHKTKKDVGQRNPNNLREKLQTIQVTQNHKTKHVVFKNTVRDRTDEEQLSRVL